MPKTKKELRQRVLLRIFGDLGIVGPFLVSFGTGLTAIVLHFNPVVLGVSALCALGGASKLAWNLYRTEQISKEVLESIQFELEGKREQELDALDARCREDDDPSDERMLRELRELHSRFKGDHAWMKTLNRMTVMEIEAGAEDLFHGCIHRIERSLDLRDDAVQMSNREARQGLMQARRGLLEEVQEGVSGLGQLYARMQQMSADRIAGRAQDSVGGIRTVLDQFEHIMDLDERVEQRLKNELHGDPNRYDEYLK